MRRIDEQYLKTPFYGSRRITVWLTQEGFAVNRKRVQRLMRLMDIEAIYPRPRTTETAAEHAESLHRADKHLAERYGRTPQEIAEAVRRRYGKDRTFSVPILMTSALAGLVPWSEVPSLPFELACLPQAWFRFLKLPVVSYALPALIAIVETDLAAGKSFVQIVQDILAAMLGPNPPIPPPTPAAVVTMYAVGALFISPSVTLNFITQP